MGLKRKRNYIYNRIKEDSEKYLKRLVLQLK